MAQPQVTLVDYFGGKSVVLRSIPTDYFKPYSEFLTGLTGKWNPYLKDPSGQGTLGGWIFPKKNEAQVRQGVQQILTGQVPAQAVAATGSVLTTVQGQTLTTLGTQQPQPFFQTQQPANTLQQLLSAAQARNMAQTPAGGQSPSFIMATPVATLPTDNILAPLNQSPGAAPPGYQQITYVVIKPETGGTLQLTIGTQKVPVKVESVEVQNGITKQAIIQLPDGQRTMIRLVNDQWSIPGFTNAHTITLQ